MVKLAKYEEEVIEVKSFLTFIMIKSLNVVIEKFSQYRIKSAIAMFFLEKLVEKCYTKSYWLEVKYADKL